MTLRPYLYFPLYYILLQGFLPEIFEVLRSTTYSRQPIHN